MTYGSLSAPDKVHKRIVHDWTSSMVSLCPFLLRPGMAIKFLAPVLSCLFCASTFRYSPFRVRIRYDGGFVSQCETAVIPRFGIWNTPSEEGLVRVLEISDALSIPSLRL